MKKNIIPQALLLLTILVLAAGCKPFTAKPSSFTFEGISWQVGSAELVDELAFPPIKPNLSTEMLLVVQFEVLDQTDYTYREAELRQAFSEVTIRITGKKPDQTMSYHKEYKGRLTSMDLVFSVPKGTTLVDLVLPDSQVISISVK